MYCIRPLIKVDKKKPIYREFQQEFFSWKHFPAKDKLNLYLKYKYVYAYPCGNCLNCVNMNRYHWVKKLELEKKNWDCTYFITLTYSDSNYPGQLEVKHLQNFIKYLRKENTKIKYFGCGEYGGKTGRAHYHLILFTNKKYDLEFVKQTKTGPLFECKDFNRYWLNKGYIWVAFDINSASFAYVASYSNKNYLKQVQNEKYKSFKQQVELVNKTDNYSHLSNLQKYLFIDNFLIPNILFRKNEFLIMSKKPPIGASYKKINNMVPSTLLKWHHKKMDTINETIYSKELERRQQEYHQYLQLNNITDKIHDNNILYEKNNSKKIKKML